MKKIPNEIFLQVDPNGTPVTDQYESGDITWCADRVNTSDVRYQRTDAYLRTSDGGRARNGDLVLYFDTVAGWFPVFLVYLAPHWLVRYIHQDGHLVTHPVFGHDIKSMKRPI